MGRTERLACVQLVEEENCQTRDVNLPHQRSAAVVLTKVHHFSHHLTHESECANQYEGLDKGMGHGGKEPKHPTLGILGKSATTMFLATELTLMSVHPCQSSDCGGPRLGRFLPRRPLRSHRWASSSNLELTRMSEWLEGYLSGFSDWRSVQLRVRPRSTSCGGCHDTRQSHPGIGRPWSPITRAFLLESTHIIPPLHRLFSSRWLVIQAGT